MYYWSSNIFFRCPNGSCCASHRVHAPHFGNHCSGLLAFRSMDTSPCACYEVTYTTEDLLNVFCMDRILPGPMEKEDSWRRKTHSAAVKIWLELVQIAFIGLSCPFISPVGAKVSTFQSLRVPPLQPLSRTGAPGTRPRAHTQSLWALGTCWKREGRQVSQGCKKF